MAPPLITPSPHRFLTSKPANPPVKSSSSLRFQHGASQSASSQQFTSVPRFNFSSTQKPLIDNETAAKPYPSPLSRRPHLPDPIPSKIREDIEETGSDNEEVEGLENGGSKFALFTQPASKRRRPNTPEAVIISSGSSSPSPPPTTPPYHSIEEDDHEADTYSNDFDPPARPRFILPTPKPTGTPSIPSRPPLILPPRSPSPTTTTPAFCSPHRRGQKYIPGGLASTVRDWIVETSQQAHNRAHARRGEEEIWDMRFRVGDYRVDGSNGGVILVQERSEAKRWMLVGIGRDKTKVEIDCVVGIREPSWEMLVGEELYTVAIEWKVLNG